MRRCIVGGSRLSNKPSYARIIFKGPRIEDAIPLEPKRLHHTNAYERCVEAVLIQAHEPFFAHPSAVVESDAIGVGTQIWHFSYVMAGSEIGRDCKLGQNVFVAAGVKLGDGVKVQNNVSLYQGTLVEDYVFLGPSCVLTNVTNPRSEIVRNHLYEATHLKRGATIGANATIVCGVCVGAYAFVAAGCVIAQDVPDYALMVGVPGRHIGYMSRHGQKLLPFGADNIAVCPESQWRYERQPQGVVCLDWDAYTPLDAAHKEALGQSYHAPKAARPETKMGFCP